jgi:hypothetical protein
MQVVTTSTPQILRLMLTNEIDTIRLTNETENTIYESTDFDVVDKGYYKEITIELNLQNQTFYKIEALSEGALICYDKLFCTDGDTEPFIQRFTQNTFITI